MKSFASFLLAVAILSATSACSSNIDISQVTDRKNLEGVPFYVYSPWVTKGWLLKHTSPAVGVCRRVAFKRIVMLPDGPLYQLKFRPSEFGIGDYSITLRDDGTLSVVAMNSDAQFDENLTAVSGLLKSVSPAGVVGVEAAVTDPHCNTGESFRLFWPYKGPEDLKKDPELPKDEEGR